MLLVIESEEKHKRAINNFNFITLKQHFVNPIIVQSTKRVNIGKIGKACLENHKGVYEEMSLPSLLRYIENSNFLIIKVTSAAELRDFLLYTSLVSDFWKESYEVSVVLQPVR